MNRNPAALTEGIFDVLVIGGGIFGAGVARDAALRGLRVALVDNADFASGTSSRSSKLIHGGFRYLEQCAFGLVTEACRERETLLHIAPHLVRPVPFMFPVYDGDLRSLAKIRLGMTLYDRMAQNPPDARHQSLSPERTLMKEPALARHGLRGAVRFFDCQTDDARFCLDNILDAAGSGAVCANYCEIVGFNARENRLVAARAVDRRANSGVFEIHARAFINAAGPWVERIAGLAPFDSRRVALSPTKGVHLLLPRLTEEHAVAFQSRADGRVLLVVPWGECTLVGTTDTDWTGSPADVCADSDDIAYLLREVQSLFPDSKLCGADVITTFAGVRALLRSDVVNPSARSRENQITQLGQNLFSVTGGKYTTYRVIAEQVVNRLTNAPCRTADTPLPPHRPPPKGEKIADAPVVFASDIAYACEHEMALTVSDVMRRRTGLALSRHGGVEVAGTVARLMAEQLGWSDAEMYAQLQDYIEESKRSLP